MTNEEELKILLIKKDCWDWEGLNCDSDEGCEVCEKAMDIAIESFKKQIPKRPYIKRNTKKLEWVCGNCKIETVEYKDFYCSHCGWKIDWSDDDGK